MLKPIIAAYEELAVGIADEFTATHDLQVLLRDFGEHAGKLYNKKAQIGETEGALMMNQFEDMYLKIKNSLEEISVILRRIQSSNNTQKYNMLRETANGAMFVKNGREDLNVNEAGINLDPSSTGIHFVEYEFDREECRIISSKLIENPGEYGLMTIIDNWTPNVTAYVDSVFQILNTVYTRRMSALTNTLASISSEMESLNKVHYRESISNILKIIQCCHNYVSEVDKSNMYQFIQNSVKNFSIVNQAINYYLNDGNISIGF